MNVKQDSKAPTKMRGWVKAVFVTSLALNLAVLGAVGGSMLMHDRGNPHHPSRLDMAGGPLTRALSDEDRQVIGKKMRQAYRNGHQTREQQREHFQALIANLKAEPFDPDAVQAQMSKQRAAFKDRLELGQTILLERLTQMSHDERVTYADRLQERVRHHKRRHQKTE